MSIEAPNAAAAPPAPPPQVTIDGVAHDFAAGESVIVLAKRKGVHIPYYCWHPHLSVAANCRMCLVEVEKAPKLMPACQTECKAGMVVNTRSAKVEAARRAVHEFLLVNHPIDCPICDQAGECKLQDYYMKFQGTGSRMREVKVHKRKLVPLGPHVMYNAERCIVCTRCVRFMDEVAGHRQLGVFSRGDHSTIGTFDGQPLDDPYSLNTVDVCPVGALTSRVFRFKQRVWNLRRTPSLCGGCARGCNVHLDHRAGQVYRMLPRPNDLVNKVWLCDEGRLTYSRANEQRLEAPQLGPRATVGGTPLTGQTAAGGLAERLRPLLGQGRLQVLLSCHTTCEEAFVLGQLCRGAFALDQVHLVGYPDGDADKLLRVADKNPNRQGLRRVLASVGIEAQWADAASLPAPVAGRLVIGHQMGAQMHQRIAADAGPMWHLGASLSPLVTAADLILPTLGWAQSEGAWVNVDQRVQALTPACPSSGLAQPLLGWLAAVGQILGLAQAASWASIDAVRAAMAADGGDLGQVPWAQLPAEGHLWARPVALGRSA